MLKSKSLIHRTLIIFVFLFSANCNAMEKEYMLKAGFLYNFARFSQWHSLPQKDNFFTLCSPDKHFIELANIVLKERIVKGLPLKNKHIALNDISNVSCDMLFITVNTIANWENLKVFPYDNIMVIGETEGFIKNGGHIRFFLSSGKIRFEIAPKKLKEVGITMSSKVLRLARVVDR